MKSFDEIRGHEQAIDLLRTMLDRRRVPQALLFQGPAGIGKGTTAMALARSLLCNEQTTACGRCEACRLFAAGNHEDFTLLRRLPKHPPRKGPRGPELNRDINVDQIRQMTGLIGQTPRRSQHRVILIDDADLMNRNAQNALLKSLEEPAPKVVMVLVAANPNHLLPTVRSRCMAIRFAALRSRELADILVEMDYEAADAEARAAFAEGRPGRAIELDPDDLRLRRDALLQSLGKLSTGQHLDEIPSQGAEIAGKDETDFHEGMDLLQGLLRDAARAAIDPEDPALIHIDRAEPLSRLGRRLGPVRTARLIELTSLARQASRRNQNRTLLSEQVLAAIAGGPLHGVAGGPLSGGAG